jgi:hypothetical protein
MQCDENDVEGISPNTFDSYFPWGAHRLLLAPKYGPVVASMYKNYILVHNYVPVKPQRWRQSAAPNPKRGVELSE